MRIYLILILIAIVICLPTAQLAFNFFPESAIQENRKLRDFPEYSKGDSVNLFLKNYIILLLLLDNKEKYIYILYGF